MIYLIQKIKIKFQFLIGILKTSTLPYTYYTYNPVSIPYRYPKNLDIDDITINKLPSFQFLIGILKTKYHFA